jgi:uncharacterized protein YciI
MNPTKSVKLALLSLLIAAGFIMAQTKSKVAQYPATQPAKEKQTFAIIYEPGPKWAKGVSIFDQDLQEHGEYMQKLLDTGKLELGGPFSDSSGGMAIVLVDSEDEASAIMKADPAIKKGIFTAKVRPWYIVFRATAKN